MSQNRQTKPTTDIITINKLKATGKRQFFIGSLKKLLSSLPFLSQKRIQQFTLYLKIPKKHSPLEESWNHTTAHRCDHDSCSCRHLKDKSSVKAAAAPRLVKCADKVKKKEYLSLYSPHAVASCTLSLMLVLVGSSRHYDFWFEKKEARGLESSSWWSSGRRCTRRRTVSLILPHNLSQKHNKTKTLTIVFYFLIKHWRNTVTRFLPSNFFAKLTHMEEFKIFFALEDQRFAEICSPIYFWLSI